MARPIKKGLEYYPQDTDIHNDLKIRRLRNEFGATGYLVYEYVKTLCYKENGYWIGYYDGFCFDVADVLKSGTTENSVKEILKGCFRMSLFSESVFKAFRIITSKGIQERYIKAKKGALIDERYNVLNNSLINVSETPTKENKSKVNETIEGGEEFLKFYDWVNANAPKVNKMKEPFSENQFKSITSKYPIATIQSVLCDMHNKSTLLKDYDSAYLTCNNWCKRRANQI